MTMNHQIFADSHDRRVTGRRIYSISLLTYLCAARTTWT